MTDKDFRKLLDDEWMKRMEELTAQFRKAIQSSVSYQSLYLNNIELPLGDVPEFELDDDGVTPVGYKVLLHVPKETKWLLSPNLIYKGIWKDNQIRAHYTPNAYDHAGIHGTKTFDDLEPWWNEYRARIPQIHFIRDRGIKFVIVKIALWGVVVETEKGFRAEYAKIIEKILEE